MFSWERLKGLLGFGWKLLCSALLDTVYNNLRSLIIGKVYSSADLAYYNEGKKFPNLIVTNINTSIDSVLLPAMAKEQDDKDRVKNMTRRSIMVSCFIMAPLMIGLACCASNIVTVVLTENAIAALNLPKGGEVITTPFTFASTTHAIVRNGLVPVFCDVKEDDYTIDTKKMEELITDQTVAIVPVHVYGNMCDVEEIDRIANKHGLKVIYDAAHAFGVKYVKAFLAG